MIKAIITDIEGTTSSLSFVKDVLFPYARTHLSEFVTEHQYEDNLQAILSAVRQEVGKELNLEQAIEQLIRWIDQDKKITPLKTLQGLMWQSGYEQGDFKGHVYPDAYQALREWHQAGIDLFVYSSGSVFAQKLLFGHSEFGDLNYLFKDYFDTRIGAKIESTSYQHILESLKHHGSEVLFLSDLEPELKAARQAGMHALCLVRDQASPGPEAYPWVRDFSAIQLDAFN